MRECAGVMVSDLFELREIIKLFEPICCKGSVKSWLVGVFSISIWVGLIQLVLRENEKYYIIWKTLVKYYINS